MSFIGFVSFSTAPGAGAAEQALRRWLAASAASAQASDWTSTASRGFFSAFSLVAGADHHAKVECDHGVRFVGDVPRAWLTGAGASARRARMAAAPAGATLDDALPETEFAMGLWEEAASRLTLYRCPFGTRALFYVCVPRQWIAFASLPEPLFALPGVRDVIDEAALPSQLLFSMAETAPTDSTVFARLRRLPPAHRLRFTPDAVAVDEYWQFAARQETPFGIDDPEVPRELRRLLDRAVRRRVDGHAHVGSQLSGGLDSSAVTALAHAQKDANARLHAYSILSRDEHRALIDPEERRLAADLTARLDGVLVHHLPHDKAHRPYYLYQQEYLDRPLPDMVFKLGADHRLHAAARRDGCGVVLTGWGGDQMVSARGSLHVLAMIGERRWRLVWRNLTRYGGLAGAARATREDIIGPLWAGSPARGWTADESSRIRAAFAGKPLAGMVAAGARASESRSLRQRRRDRLRRSGFAVSLELHDWFGQRAGVHVRHPLLDRDVISFCDGMPPEWVGHLGFKRRAFRAALVDVLPSDAIAREKTLLARPADNERWRRRYQAYQVRALADLAASDTWLHQYLNFPALAGMPPRVETDGFSPARQLGASALVVARFGPSS
jgi:asparagine synthase (glutamine-hydrolysing)